MQVRYQAALRPDHIRGDQSNPTPSRNASGNPVMNRARRPRSPCGHQRDDRDLGTTEETHRDPRSADPASDVESRAAARVPACRVAAGTGWKEGRAEEGQADLSS